MRAAVTGSSVCVLHGGSIPAAKEQIERALLALQESAIEALREVFATATDRVLADTAFKLLDRTGHGPQTTLKVQEDTDDLSSLSNEELLKKHQELGKFLEATRTNGTIVLGPNSGTTH
jgi:hypothetical protein